MFALVPEVHLFICLDPRVSPGPLLHCLDIARAQEWQQETVLVCDESWKKYVNVDQPVLFMDRKRLFASDATPTEKVTYLDTFLEQLDNFEIQKITQIGELSWARWLTAYFESEGEVQIDHINWDASFVSSVELVNSIASELALDLEIPVKDKTKSSAVYLDPYCEKELSPLFVEMLKNAGKIQFPHWLRVICLEQDQELFDQFGLGEYAVDVSETEAQLFNQSILCFSDDSLFAQTSRAYNVALFGCSASQSMYLPGDIQIKVESGMHFSELLNILSYWKMGRLKELAFQWLNMGIEVEHLESFHGRVVKRNLLNYSSDLFHSQILVKEFLINNGDIKKREMFEMIARLRKEVSNDPYSLSFSLKILLNIVERMVSSAECGERLFERLGSDYHRIIIGEALVEGLIEAPGVKPEKIDVKGKLKAFHHFLIKLDHLNDQTDSQQYIKESA